MGKTTPSGGAKAPARGPRGKQMMTAAEQPDSGWPARFLDELAKTGNVRATVALVGVSPSLAYRRKRKNAAFAAEWREAVAAALHAAGETYVDPEDQPGRHWRTHFLAGLVESSSVTAAAEAARITPSRAYKERTANPKFAAQWRIALHDGYELLEMEVLAYLRQPDAKVRMDVAGATRLLAAHRDEVAKQRALIDGRSEREVLDSIDAMIDEMREREAANAKILAEGGSDERG